LSYAPKGISVHDLLLEVCVRVNAYFEDS